MLWALQEVCKTKEVTPEGVGLVTPYKGQVTLIKRLIRERPGLQNFRVGLEVESVDGFQGQEKEVIIFCAVRNNREGKVGFLSDWRRLNVMLTRARRGCIVIGSRRTLMFDPLWRQWLLWASARGAVCGESPKGTWIPRYLVDDRDGMWTVKAAAMMSDPNSKVAGVQSVSEGGTVSTMITAKLMEGREEPEEVVDSWEDLESPAASPQHQASSEQGPVSPLPALAGGDAPDGGLGGDDDELCRQFATLAPFPGTAGKQPKSPGSPSRQQERLEAEDLEQFGLLDNDDGDDAGEEEGAPGSGDALDEERTSSPAGSPSRSSLQRLPSLGPQDDVADDEDELRSSRNADRCPKSPARQLALASLGLWVDDLDLDESAAVRKGRLQDFDPDEDGAAAQDALSQHDLDVEQENTENVEDREREDEEKEEESVAEAAIADSEPPQVEARRAPEEPSA